jgi:hypothetical protein
MNASGVGYQYYLEKGLLQLGSSWSKMRPWSPHMYCEEEDSQGHCMARLLLSSASPRSRSHHIGQVPLLDAYTPLIVTIAGNSLRMCIIRSFCQECCDPCDVNRMEGQERRSEGREGMTSMRYSVDPCQCPSQPPTNQKWHDTPAFRLIHSHHLGIVYSLIRTNISRCNCWFVSTWMSQDAFE